jgi:hypothetical protein
MKRILFVLAMALVCSGAVLAEPADVLKGEDFFICLDANMDPAPFVDRYTRIETNSDTGEVIWTVHGECLGATGQKAVHWSDQNTPYFCWFDAPYFKLVITPSGKASLKCQNWPFDD